MAHPHIPDLAAIDALPNLEIRFYAILGAAISLSAGLELTYLDIFILGERIHPKAAAKVFYETAPKAKPMNAAKQRDRALNAMSIRLKPLKRDPLKAEWKILREAIVDITKKDTLRHLVAHNVMMVVENGVGIGDRAIGDAPEQQFVVQQFVWKVNSGAQSQTADFISLLRFCRDLIQLLLRLDDFLRKLS